jgi:DNA-binding NtrC family response regulator
MNKTWKTADFPKIKVLIVDEETPFRINLANRLKLENFTVFQCTGGSEARRLIRKKNIDVVLLCLVKLKKGGLSLLQSFKKFRPYVEVIILTGSGQIALSIEGMKLGVFDDFLIPFDIRLLVNRIQDAAECKEKGSKNRKTWFEKYEAVAMAISFAEVGEYDTARSYLAKKQKK